MKKFLIALLMPVATFAQQTISTGIVKSTISTSADNNGIDRNSELGKAFMRLWSREVEMTAYYKDHMRKLVTKTKEITTTSIYNDKTGITVMLIDTKDGKTAYTQTREQRSAYALLADSLGLDMNGPNLPRSNKPVNITVNVTYTDKEKIFNGINCKKAIVTTLNSAGDKKKIEVWYTNDYLFPTGTTFSVAGTFKQSVVDGVPVRYKDTTMMLLPGSDVVLTHIYELKSIDTLSVVDDQEFVIPPGYAIKTWDEYLKENPYGPVLERKSSPFIRRN